MPLDTSGALLEGVRVSEGNNPFTYPPRDVVADPSEFNSVTARAEYCLVTSSLDPSKRALEIADPDLVFRWTRNDPGALRFSYDSYSKRWLPSPGGPPDVLGPLSNETRLSAPVPDPSLTDSPFSLYVGSPVRILTFSVQLVGEDADFSPPSSVPSGTVQISSESGLLNFSADDVDNFGGQDVLSQRQNFFERGKATGRLGALPASSAVDYFLFLNPRPASGQRPLVRIGYSLHLVAVEVADEAALGSPAPGTFRWALDTGRIRLSPTDVDDRASEPIYYDGVSMGGVSPARTSVGSVSAFPSVAFTVSTDSVGYVDQRYVVYAELSGSRVYWTVSVVPTPPSSRPKNGIAVLAASTGAVYLSSSDVSRYAGWSFSFLDSLMPVEDGVSLQVFRSGVNGSGVASVPDFTVLYFVDGQIVVDGLFGPFVMLPTTPVVDDVLEYRIDQGPSSSGTFTGLLADGTDPDGQGLGYLLDLDSHRLSFSFRRSFELSLPSATPAVKLPDAAISPLGFEVAEGGSPVVAGTDFGFDPVTGLLSFTEPFGQNGPDDIRGLAGTAVLPSVFDSDDPVFSVDDEGSFLLFSSGNNVGVRTVRSVVSATSVVVSPPFVDAGRESPDLRTASDVVVDRIWVELRPPLKKFSLAVAPAGSSSFSQVGQDGFSVFPGVGQVNLTDPAEPGSTYLVTYVALFTDDDGATYEPVNRVEKALFKVRHESAVVTPGSTVAGFNQAGRPVSVARPMSVYVDGVPLGQAFFEFQAPGSLRLSTPLLEGQEVFLDYWVETALGGETGFDLLVAPVDVDYPEVSAGSSSVSLNGDQTSLVAAGSALLVSSKEALMVASSSYDSSVDVTLVQLTAPAVFASDGGAILSCAPLGDYFLPESSPVDTFVSGSSSFTVSGDATPSYRLGTLALVDGDPYYVLGSRLSSGRTSVTTAAPARRNYVIPSVVRSVRPVFLPGVSFQTSRQANLDFEFTLVRNGPRAAVLARGIDYSVTAGGSITLSEDAVFGDSLYAFYVAQDPRPAGTVFDLNYAHAVAPSAANGLAGQRLVATYNLYAPDSFFYRVETVLTFLPEVQDMLRQGSQSTSGPNTGDAKGMSNKDFGRPSLYYAEQHEGNLDFEIARLLLFYNDLINLYEDALSDLDGRVVGGASGRFRFDDRFDNPPRAAYADVTNDIDDRVQLYTRLQLTGFYTFSETPVYGSMAVPNSLSRIFPTAGVKPTALNDKTGVLDFGKTLGSIGVDNLRSVGTLRSSRSNQFFTSSAGTAFTVEQNGDAEHNVPPFQVGEDVVVYGDDGAPSGAPTQVSAVAGNVVTLGSGTGLVRGSILKDLSDSDNSTNHFYQPGRDVSVDLDNGQISNMYLGIPILFPQTQVSGNEVVDVPITFGNGSTEPRRVPALDGETLNDDGSVPAPRLRRYGESLLLQDELSALGNLGRASTVVAVGKVSPSLVDVVGSSVRATVGDVVQFVSGPNAGQSRNVISVVDPSHFIVSPGFALADPAGSPMASLNVLSVSSGAQPGTASQITFLDGPSFGLSRTVATVFFSGVFRISAPIALDPGSNFLVTSSQPVLTDVVARELGILSGNVAAPAVPPSLIPSVASEIKSALAVARYSGRTLASGTGVAAPGSLTDSGAAFVLSDVVPGCLIVVPSGPNTGVYLVDSVSSHVLILDTDSPYAPMPSSGSVPYEVVKPESFLGQDQFGLVARFLRETLAFYASTLAWSSSLGPAGVAARISTIGARQARIPSFVDDFQGVLVDEGLYDVRYLWIDQRTNRKTGNLVRQRQAAERRVEDTRDLVADQKKLLVSEGIS